MTSCQRLINKQKSQTLLFSFETRDIIFPPFFNFSQRDIAEKRSSQCRHDNMAASWTKRFDLAGKIATVTGATKGIGLEVCKVLSDAGADVVAVGRDVDGLESVKTIVESNDRRKCAIINADLSTVEGCKHVIIVHVGSVRWRCGHTPQYCGCGALQQPPGRVRRGLGHDHGIEPMSAVPARQGGCGRDDILGTRQDHQRLESGGNDRTRRIRRLLFLEIWIDWPHQGHDIGMGGVTKIEYFGTYIRYLPTNPTSPHCDTSPTNPRFQMTPNTAELVCFFLETL